MKNSKLEVFLKFLLIAAVFLLPLLFSHSTYNPCAIKLVFLRLMLTIGCVVWLLNSFIKSGFELVKTQLNLPVFIFISIGFLSFIICPFKVLAYKELLKVLGGVVVFFLIVNSVKDQISFNYIIRVL